MGSVLTHQTYNLLPMRGLVSNKTGRLVMKKYIYVYYILGIYWRGVRRRVKISEKNKSKNLKVTFLQT